MSIQQTMAAAFVSCKMALYNSVKSGNTEWQHQWRMRLNRLVDLIPSGSGIDVGPRILDDIEIKPDAIRFDVSIHHMNDVGMYDGWTSHTVTIRPAFSGVTVHVSGHNRRDVKDHIVETMEHAFTRNVTWDEPAQRWIMCDVS